MHEPVHTCELNDVNPFDYITELQRYAEELATSRVLELPDHLDHKGR